MPFARWESFTECTLEMKKLGHDEESANKICGSIKEREEKGMLYKAASVGLDVLSKADDETLVVGGWASWDIVDDEGETITVEAQSKGLERFMNQAKEWQSITANHKEFKLAQPLLKYVDSKGNTYYTHVNEKGTYLISEIRNDNLKTTQYYRKAVKEGRMNGYSITGLPLAKGETPKIITDIEYHAVTLCEKGVMKAINPKTREVAVISKSVDEESLQKASIAELKTQLETLYKQRDALNKKYSPQPRELDSEFAVIYAKINAVEQTLRKKYEAELSNDADLTKASVTETAQDWAKTNKLQLNNNITELTKCANTNKEYQPKNEALIEGILSKYGFGKAKKDKEQPFL